MEDYAIIADKTLKSSGLGKIIWGEWKATSINGVKTVEALNGGMSPKISNSFAEEPNADGKSREQVDAELESAQKKWLQDERKKEDEFEKIHKQKLEEWRLNRLNNKASYDDHPDVVMMKRLTGQEGTLIAPSVAREYDNMLTDRGWYPVPLSQSQKEANVREGVRRPTERGSFEAKGSHPDVPPQIKLPAYNSVRDYFLKRQNPAGSGNLR